MVDRKRLAMKKVASQNTCDTTYFITNYNPTSINDFAVYILAGAKEKIAWRISSNRINISSNK